MIVIIASEVPYHFFESSYFNVAGTDRRADSMFLKEPPLTLHSIYKGLNFWVQSKHTLPVNISYPEKNKTNK